MTTNALMELADRLAYYIWRMIPLRYIFTPLATWLLPYAGAYACTEEDRLRERWWRNAEEITKGESE